MSNHTNHRRGDVRRTETGPRWESHDPGKGCNSTHVARSRRKWKRIASRSERRTGVLSRKFYDFAPQGAGTTAGGSWWTVRDL